MFISFKAQRSGFVEGCRPFVGFDGCFLKGAYGGVLLTAVTLDANNSIFPIAFAVAEAENKETWSWFFHYFEEFFGPFTSENGFHGPLTFMSDRQKVSFTTGLEHYSDSVMHPDSGLVMYLSMILYFLV
mgnify:FL=1